MDAAVPVINAGSSSVKFALWSARAKGSSCLANTPGIGGGAQIPWHDNDVRHRLATV